ncbi:MAG TPA: HAMP domain-containing sensor histidine kinase [Candidatus Dormibacteraeota bacterium]|jgi:two-component system OmpR family sensor kinase|nr:HAMP domain-containing sensor histidine kinase [Candidatus Dormibacteraeota bacterium]
MSLRLRLLVTLVPLFILGLVAADFGTFTALQSFLVSRVDAQLLSGHPAMASAVQGRGFGHDAQAPQLPLHTWTELVDPSGKVIAGPVWLDLLNQPPDTTSHPLLPATLPTPPPAKPTYITVAGSGAIGHYRVIVDNEQGNFLIVAAPMDDVQSTLDRLLVLEVGVSGGVTIVLLVATWLIVRRGLRPLRRMGETARTIVASDLSSRIEPANERTEVGQLGLALNTMLDQLEAAFAERARTEQKLRHFVSDASHELRTPLTSMRGYAELLRRNPDMSSDDIVLAMRRIEAEAQRMGILVDDLLLLARLDQGRPLERRPVDLDAMVRDAYSDARVTDPRRTISLRVLAPLVVTGDDLRLRQALGNVLRNALVHTPPGTPVEIELRPDDGHAVLEVVDHGPGVPAGHAERIFERFHRADPGRSRDQGGSGLGLSITAAIVGSHGGTVSVHPTPGGGATFRIELPLAADVVVPAADPAPAESPVSEPATPKPA